MSEIQKTAYEFIADQSLLNPLFVAPDIGVRQGFAQPYFTADGGLAEMAVPINAPVPVGPEISERERHQLGRGVRAFFRDVLKPTVKHI